MPETESLPINLKVLGALEAWQGDRPVSLGPVRQRVVLGVLALHTDHPMSREQLIDAVWGHRPPAYAVNLLQKHVSGLRRTLEPVRSKRSRSALSWTGAGYRLEPPVRPLDLHEFEDGLARARTARAAHDLPAAARALRDGLRAWRGPVLDGLTSPLLDADRELLAERRIGAIEERIELDLVLGHDTDLVTELRQLVARHPLRERLRELLMRALFRAGRRGEAFAAYQEAHQHLLDELGVEPNTELQELHQRMLRDDPELGPVQPAAAAVTTVAAAAPRPSPLAPPAQMPPPAQLPHGMAHFTGRAEALEQLDALAEADGAMVIAAVVGTAGVGKTALAVHWAHQVSHRFPDGQLYLDLRGVDPHREAIYPGEALRFFLDAFGVPAELVPAGRDDQAALFRSVLAGRRVLVVLDNARDTEQIRPLLPGAPGCLVLVTSRNRLPGLVAEGAVPLSLDLLTPTEAQDLLVKRLGARRVAAEPDAAADIVAACAGLPLTLAIVAARAALRPRHALGAIAAELRATNGGLDAFAGDTTATDARTVLSWSYERLGPDAARMFRMLCLHPGPDLCAPAASSLAGVPLAKGRRLLAELSGVHLVEEPAPGRYGLHDLLRAYAGEQLLMSESEPQRQAAQVRLFDHYLHTALGANRSLFPGWPSVPVDPPDPGAHVLDLTEPCRAQTWFTTEYTTLLAAINQAYRAGFDAYVGRLMWTTGATLQAQGRWHDWAAALTTGIAAAERSRDLDALGLAQRLLGRAEELGRSLDEAEEHARAAARVTAWRDLGGAYHRLGRSVQAAGCFERVSP